MTPCLHFSRRQPPRFFPTCYPDQQQSLPLSGNGREEYADDVHRFEDPSVTYSAAAAAEGDSAK